jgi:hypothetical protein
MGTIDQDAYRAIESRVPVAAGIVPFHPAVPLRDLPLLRDLDPIPRQRHQPLDHQNPVLRRRPANDGISGPTHQIKKTAAAAES